MAVSVFQALYNNFKDLSTPVIASGSSAGAKESAILNHAVELGLVVNNINMAMQNKVRITLHNGIQIDIPKA